VNFIKKTNLLLLATLSGVLLLVFAVSLALWLTLSNPTALKGTLETTGVYDDFTSGLHEELQEQYDEHLEDYPLIRPLAVQAVRDAFPPQFVQESADEMLDGFYDWLRGETERPVVEINIEQNKRTLAESAADYAVIHLESLETCTSFEEIAQNRGADIMSLSCRPPGLDLDTERIRLVDAIMESEVFAQNTTFSTENLGGEGDELFTEQYAYLQDAYTWLQRLPWIAGLALLITVGGILLLHQSRRKNMKLFALILFAAGIVTILGSLLLQYSIVQLGNYPYQFEHINNQSFRSGVELLNNSLYTLFNQWLLGVGIIYIIAGSFLFGAFQRHKPRKQQHR
jgi:hypothetical protein